MNQTDFREKLQDDKQLIDADIKEYAKYLQKTTKETYGEASAQTTNALLAILERGGKRLRGALAIEGYRMCGGQNEAMILQAARAIEIIHASLLIIDDVQDRSAMRRGGPAAHIELTTYAQDQHIGESLATNAALLGIHGAMMILANLDAPAELRSNVLSILNRTLAITIHGQTNDLANTLSSTTSISQVEQVITWKTATYSILNPLHVGMVLAGADCHATDAITPYATAVGRAFQLVDDLLIFAPTAKTGKEPSDDIREGKRTLLIVYALQKTTGTDHDFLLQCLGNAELSKKEFERCLKIIEDSGARQYVQEQANDYINQALVSLHTELPWSAEGTAFLQGLAKQLIVPQS